MVLKVLVVDDSALMRRYISEIIQDRLDAQVNTARDGEDALQKIKQWRPDVVTLDINMPVMDGLTCLSHIMASDPHPVVMISSLTERDALATFEALHMGAVDFVCKPGGTVSVNIKSIADELVRKVKAAGRVRGRRMKEAVQAQAPTRAPSASPRQNLGDESTKLILIGLSTGGPSTLEQILPVLPSSVRAPIVVAQHMPASFTGVFANRLDGICKHRVVELDRRSKLEPGCVYIAQGDHDVEVCKLGVGLTAQSIPASSDYIWHPSVDRMVESALNVVDASKMIGVLLTGMGNDGAVSMAKIKKQGGRTIAESEDSAVIFGMPKELIALEGASIVLPKGKIASQLALWARERTVVNGIS